MSATAEVDGDPIVGLVGFTHALRAAGLPCDPHRVQAYLAAAAEVDLASTVQLYWAGRLTLCADPDDLPRYDTAFEAWFRDPERRQPPPGRPREMPKQTRMASLTPEQASGRGDEDDAPDLQVAASETEVLRQRDLADLTDAEREHLRQLMALLRPDPPTRRALRKAPSRRGEPDPRATLRAMLRAGGETLELPRRHAGRRARRVVLLVDVSGSMAPYADSLLRFAHAVARRMPAEVFTLGTRMTRITRQLRQRDPDRALAAARAVPDYSGGTRLGETLRAFLDRWGQRGVARRAVVVVFSDGWERGDAAALAEQMARLRRLAHTTVLWVNPHAGRSGYAPVQGGIVAALPHVDRLLAGHSLATLEELLEEVRSA